MKFELKHLVILIILSLVFTFFWFYPWQILFVNLEWFRFLIGITLFIAPGMLIQQYFNESLIFLKPSALTNGFVISILITGVLGAIARINSWGFNFVVTSLWLIGILGVFLCTFKFRYKKSTGLKILRKDVWLSLALLVAIVAIILAAKISIPSLIYGDDFTYNALLHYYQNSDSYTFEFPRALGRMEIARFWIAFWPLVEAVLADLSMIDGLLITGIYIAPSLVVLSMLAIYSLGRSLGFSRHIALLAVVSQIASLIRLTQSDQAGILFFDKLPEDKVVAAFVIAPIAFRLAIEYLTKPNLRRLLLFSFCYIAFTFTHPVMLGFSTLIIGLMGLLFQVQNKKTKSYINLLIVMLLVLSIPLYIRMLEGAEITSFTITEAIDTGSAYKLKSGRLTVLTNELFYGISPSLTRGFPYEFLLLAGIVGLFFIKRRKAASFITAANIILAISILPYTGWIIGYLSSPFQLWRLTWLMPFGIAIAFLTETGIDIIEKITQLKTFKPLLGKVVPFCFILVMFIGMIYLLPWAKGNLGFGGRKPGFELWYQDYIEIGQFLKNIENTGEIIVGGPDRTTNDIIPSLSQVVHMVSFRNERGGNMAPIWEAMMGENTPLEERIYLFDEYDVKYLLIRGNPEWMVEIQVSYPEKFILHHENRKLQLFEYSP
jgi:hypothetical protein